MRYLFYIFILISSVSFAQEKRLALVIGNANYENAPALKNPVNDALLMKETFEKLGFDVMLDTNIETRKEFYQKISDYEKLKENYSVGFVYYAGHAVQIEGINYMLATKESYESESDVKYNGLDVGIFMNQYIDPIQNEINVLILDACRNNPFEKNWLAGTRSINNSAGLAEIKNAPSGSLIAFSTAAGAKASDGNDKGKNSVYCTSLSKNMQLEGITLNKVFGNVRREVRESTGQYPAIYDQLEGRDFILKKNLFTYELIAIDSLIETQKIENYNLGLEKASKIIALEPGNVKALLRKGKINYLLNKDYRGNDFKLALDLNQNNAESYLFLSEYYQFIGNISDAFNSINKAIKIDSNVSEFFALRASLNISNEYYFDALKDFNKAIDLEPFNENYLFGRGRLNALNLNKIPEAIEDFTLILRSNPMNVKAINGLGVCYENLGDYNKAIQQYEKVIKFEKTDPKTAAFGYSNLARLHISTNELDLSLFEFSKSIELDPMNPDKYIGRAYFYMDQKENYNKSLLDFSKALELEPNSIESLNGRGRLHNINNNFVDAIEDFERILILDSNSIDAINALGIIYQSQGEFTKAISKYSKGISLEEFDPISASYCYRNRALIYSQINKPNEALRDFSKAIDLNPKNSEIYNRRGVFYLFSTSEYEKALNDFTKAIDLDNSNKEYLYNRGSLLSDYLNQDKRAVEDYQKILSIDSLDIDAINAIGLIYKKQGKLDLAIAEFDKGITLEKSNPTAAAFCYSNRAEIYTNQNKLENAIQDLTKAIELDPENPLRFTNRGEFYVQKMKRPFEALVDFSLAIKLDSQSVYNWFQRGLLFSNYLNDHQSAINDFKQIMSIDSNDVVSLNWIGVFFDRLQLADSANYYFQKTIKKEKTHFEDSIWAYRNGISWSFSNLAETFLTSKDYNMANAYFKKAIEYDSENPERYFYKGCFNYRYLKNNLQALDDFGICIKLDPKNPEWYANRSMVHQIDGNVKLAKEDLDKAISLSTNHPAYIAKRGNFYTQIKAFEKAEKDISYALKIDSTNPKIYHYQILLLKDQNLIDEAISVGRKAISKFTNDTTANFLLGQIYLERKDYFKAIMHFNEAISIMKFNYSQQTIEPDYFPIFLSDCYLKLGDIYDILNEKDLKCENYQSANLAIQEETRPDKIELEKLILEKMSLCVE